MARVAKIRSSLLAMGFPATCVPASLFSGAEQDLGHGSVVVVVGDLETQSRYGAHYLQPLVQIAGGSDWYI